MSAAPQSSSKLAQASGVKSLKTQRIDVVASLLMSFLVVIGCLVLLMFVLWLTQTFTWDVGEIVIEEERVAGRGDHAEGFERDIEPPGAEEVEELMQSHPAFEIVPAPARPGTKFEARGERLGHTITDLAARRL